MAVRRFHRKELTKNFDQELTELTMVFLPSFYRFFFDEKSKSERRRRIEFCVVAHSPFFNRIKTESIIHYKLKTTSML